MKLVRGLAAVFVVCLAAWSLHQWVYLPYRCNQQVKFTKKAILAAMNRGNPQFSASLVTSEIPKLDRCARCSETVVDALVTKAALLRLVNRWDDAIRTYEESLKYDRRHEIYRNLANCYLELGRSQEAIEYFAISEYLAPRRSGVPKHLAGEVMRRARSLEPNQLPF